MWAYLLCVMLYKERQIGIGHTFESYKHIEKVSWEGVIGISAL